MYVRKMKRKLTLLKKISEMMAEKPKDMLIKSADFPDFVHASISDDF